MLNKIICILILTLITLHSRTLHVHVVLIGAIFGQILYDIVKYAQDFLPVKFSFKYYFNKLFFQLLQNVMRTDEQRA